MNKSKFIFTIGAFLFLAVLISACSTQVQIDGKTVTKAAVDPNSHSHPANKCTNSVTHTHPNGAGVHKHHYVCKKGNKNTKNSHTHPANRCTKSIRHSHPSGAKAHKHRYSCKVAGPRVARNMHSHPAQRCTKSTKHAHPYKAGHTHRYSCRGGSRVGGNAHTHPANSLTRSMRHVHPGGNRKHNHHYAR